MTTSSQDSETDKSNGTTILKLVPNGALVNTHLPYLVSEQPMSLSQHGLVLTTVEESADSSNPTSRKAKTFYANDDTDETKTSSLTSSPPPSIPYYAQQQHFQTEPQVSKIQVVVGTEDEILKAEYEKPTMINVTISGHAFSFHCSAEKQMSVLMTKEEQSTLHESEKAWMEEQRGIVAQLLQELLVRLEQKQSEPNAPSKNDPWMFYCIHKAWLPVLESVFTVLNANEAEMFVISEQDLLSQKPDLDASIAKLESEHGLITEPMEDKDIDLMLDMNAIKFDRQYGAHIIKKSICIRKTDGSGDMVAWGGSHEDLAVAALHVLPDYRKMNLGKIVMNSLGLMQIQLARKHGLGKQDEILYAHADCVVGNTPSMKFMVRCGWHSVGTFLWVRVEPKAK